MVLNYKRNIKLWFQNMINSGKFAIHYNPYEKNDSIVITFVSFAFRRMFVTETRDKASQKKKKLRLFQMVVSSKRFQTGLLSIRFVVP